MILYVVRRLLVAVLVMLGISFLSFYIVASRINPLWQFLHNEQGRKARALITRRAHLDQPVVVRYWHWLEGVVTGRGYGRTVVSNEPVWPQVWTALTHSAQLIGAALVVVVVLSLAIGTVAARRPGSPLDVALRAFAYVTWSIPAFLLALGLQLIFLELGNAYDWHPLALYGFPQPNGGAVDWLQHMVLPIATVALAFVGVHSRYVRTSMLSSLRAPYAVVARAKGIRESRVTTRHALRNSLIPFITVLTLDFGAVFGACLVADFVFRQEGMGTLLVGALEQGDPFQIQAVLTVTALIVVIASLIADLAYGWLDPRVRMR